MHYPGAEEPYDVYPQYVVSVGLSRYDADDVLTADVAAAIKQHGDEFESEAQLCRWLDEDSIPYDRHSLAVASRQLESAGRLKRPRTGCGIRSSTGISPASADHV